MTNSLVRIGGVEGDWVKRALTALIRPSSHQQRRRAAYRLVSESNSRDSLVVPAARRPRLSPAILRLEDSGKFCEREENSFCT
ncbi:hypothetical protein QQP08_026274 [Theobroma cacao]|nr:hypothetical protein QQP08_026274 [Theobroma cacao]